MIINIKSKHGQSGALSTSPFSVTVHHPSPRPAARPESPATGEWTVGVPALLAAPSLAPFPVESVALFVSLAGKERVLAIELGLKLPYQGVWPLGVPEGGVVSPSLMVTESFESFPFFSLKMLRSVQIKAKVCRSEKYKTS